MKLTYITRSAYKAILAHRSRSILTVLGVVIGVTAIILVSAIGAGAEGLIISQIAGLGSRTIAVAPGRQPSGPTDPAVVDVLFSDSLKERELDALKRKANVPTAQEVMPIVFGVESASYLGETFRPMVIGGTTLITDIFDLNAAEGVFFTDEDINSRAAVAVIGVDVKEEFFGESDAVGEKIKIKDKNLRIVGVLPPKGQVLFFNFDESVITPYTTAQQYIFGIKHFNRIIIQAQTEELVPRTVSDIEITLRNLHGITDPENDDFFVGTQAEIAETLEIVTGALTLFLASVAAISLLVGGVGIMNIMLVSVTERTREIGLRKALGATEENILIQFLLEAISLTAVGGVLGVVLGSAFSAAVAWGLAVFLELEWAFVFPVGAAVTGLIVSIAVGLLFGLYPAYKASRRSPIEALIYE